MKKELANLSNRRNNYYQIKIRMIKSNYSKKKMLNILIKTNKN